MKLNRNRRTPQIQLATPGMIDIVFLLLIFFLVNTSFRPIERQLESQVVDPAATSNLPSEPVVIRIQAGSTGFEFQVGGRKMSNRTELTQWLAQWPDRQTQVMLVAPGATPVELTILTLNDIRQLGYSKVSYVPDPSPSTSVDFTGE
jgi:biopolymer transport protein ExbD